MAAISIDPVTDGWSLAAAAYTGAVDRDRVGSVWGSCDNLYCHSDMEDTTPDDGFPDAYAPVAWNAGPFGGVCNGCHSELGPGTEHPTHTSS